MSPRGRPEVELRTAARLARLLDRLYLDPILGFIVPGAGDVLTGAAGLYLVVLGVRLGLPAIIIARMLLNIAIDTLLGMVPLVGDLFDVAFRANEKNLALLERRTAAARRASRSDWLAVVGAAIACAGALAIPVVLVIWAIRRIWG